MCIEVNHNIEWKILYVYLFEIMYNTYTECDEIHKRDTSENGVPLHFSISKNIIFLHLPLNEYFKNTIHFK